jgi:hypothetical protein
LLTIPDVQDRIRELQEEIADRSVAAALLEREERVRRLNHRALLLDDVIRERAADPDLQKIPGGNTGLIVRAWKAAGKELRPEFSVDVGLLKELRAIERQAAEELGQWCDKSEIAVNSDMPVCDVPEDASIEQIREAKRKMQEAIEELRCPRVQ